MTNKQNDKEVKIRNVSKSGIHTTAGKIKPNGVLSIPANEANVWVDNGLAEIVK